jgi:hypothetical protein
VGFHKFKTLTTFQNHLISHELWIDQKDGACAFKKDDTKDLWKDFSNKSG